jgi:hypothetical protein
VLKGGTSYIARHDDGTCSVEILTRYELRSRWLAIARLGIEYVISAMHKIVFRDMQMRLAPATRRGSAAAPDRVPPARFVLAAFSGVPARIAGVRVKARQRYWPQSTCP